MKHVSTLNTLLMSLSLAGIVTLGHPSVTFAQPYPSISISNTSPSLSPSISPTISKPQPTKVQSNIQNVQTTDISGEVLRKDGNVLTVQTANGVKQVTLPSNIKVTSNSFEATAGDIQPRDSVTIKQTQSGQVLSVDVAKGETRDFMKTVLPILVGAIVLFFLIKTIISKANKPHIKTAVG